MFIKLSAFIILGTFSFVAVNAQKTVNGGIVNGRATYLPKPEYPRDAKNFCAGGKVEVKVLISEKGEVLEAEAISGDELLREVSVEAVKKARFRQMDDVFLPTRIKGIVVYNFPLQKKCIFAGIVNERALNIPKPIILQKINVTGKVEVVIIVNPSTGKVLSAKAISGHPLLRVASAIETTFSPVNDVPQVPVRATLVYNFKSNGAIEF